MIDHTHPLLRGGTVGLLSAEKPHFPMQLTVPDGQQGQEHELLVRSLRQMGLKFEQSHGRHDDSERSVVVHKPTLAQMQQLGKLFGQETVVFSQGGRHKLVYTNGKKDGTYRTTKDGQHPYTLTQDPPENNYTYLAGHGHVSLNFNNDPGSLKNLVDDQPRTDLDEPSVPAPSTPVKKNVTLDQLRLFVKLAKTLPADQMAVQSDAVMQAVPNAIPLRQAPHSYEWHDPHTEHYAAEHAAHHANALAPLGLTKADAPVDASSPNYARYATPYGTLTPGQSSDLFHYPYQGKLDQISGLVQRHGYKTYYAGGKYGKADLANKNYNTNWLHVADPTPVSGGNLADEEYNKGYRQIHELAHALTLPEVNSLYGEGRRTGRLGEHRTLNEAQRAVHWEWLTAHKQRDLSAQLGIHIPEETFNKELNTVMHDAIHRVVHGKMAEPSSEGFNPASHKVPLQHALEVVRQDGATIGLQHPHQLAKAELIKGWPKNEAENKANEQGFLNNPVAQDQVLEGTGAKLTEHSSAPGRKPAALLPATPRGLSGVGNFMGSQAAEMGHVTQNIPRTPVSLMQLRQRAAQAGITIRDNLPARHLENFIAMTNANSGGDGSEPNLKDNDPGHERFLSTTDINSGDRQEAAKWWGSVDQTAGKEQLGPADTSDIKMRSPILKRSELAKAWPKNEAQNQANAAGFLNNPTSQDAFMEAGGPAPVEVQPPETRSNFIPGVGEAVFTPRLSDGSETCRGCGTAPATRYGGPGMGFQMCDNCAANAVAGNAEENRIIGGQDIQNNTFVPKFAPPSESAAVWNDLRQELPRATRGPVDDSNIALRSPILKRAKPKA